MAEDPDWHLKDGPIFFRYWNCLTFGLTASSRAVLKPKEGTVWSEMKVQQTTLTGNSSDEDGVQFKITEILARRALSSAHRKDSQTHSEHHLCGLCPARRCTCHAHRGALSAHRKCSSP